MQVSRRELWLLALRLPHSLMPRRRNLSCQSSLLLCQLSRPAHPLYRTHLPLPSCLACHPLNPSARWVPGPRAKTQVSSFCYMFMKVSHITVFFIFYNLFIFYLFFCSCLHSVWFPRRKGSRGKQTPPHPLPLPSRPAEVNRQYPSPRASRPKWHCGEKAPGDPSNHPRRTWTTEKRVNPGANEAGSPSTSNTAAPSWKKCFQKSTRHTLGRFTNPLMLKHSNCMTTMTSSNTLWT